jgi:hypothetical protein
MKGFHRIGLTGPGDITLGSNCVPTLDGKPLLGVRTIRIEASVGGINRVIIVMDVELGDGVEIAAAVDVTKAGSDGTR